MQDDLQDRVREGLARFLATRLSGRLRMGGALHDAFVEAEGSPWFNTADNAKAAALLAHPLLWDTRPELGAACFDLLLAMGPRDVLVRRAGPARMEVEDADPRNFRILTPTHVLTGDLSRGVLRQAMRALPGEAPAVVHSGNLLEFSFRGRRHCLDVEDAITAFGLERTDAGLLLHHTSRFTAKPRFGRAVEIGTLRYDYELHGTSPVLRLRVTFTAAPGIVLDSLRLTTGCDALSAAPGPGYGAMLVRRGGEAIRRVAEPGTTTATDGAADSLHCIQDGPPALAHGLHLRLKQGAQLLNVKVTSAEGGRLHWLLTRYAWSRLRGGETATVEEERLLLCGGERPDLDGPWDWLDRARGRDVSLCPEPGEVLDAVATHLLLAEAGRYRHAPDAARRIELRAFCDRHLTAWRAGLGPEGAPDASRLRCRDLAFVVTALDALWRATGDATYRARMGEAVDLLLSLQRREEVAPNLVEGAFLDAWVQRGTLDGHAAAMLALARIAVPGSDPRIGAALRQALAALRLSTATVRSGARSGPVDAPAVRSRGSEGWQEDAGHRTAQLALLLRALRAVQAARAAGAVALEDAEVRRLAFLAEVCATLLQARIRPKGDMLEVSAGALGEVATCEAQAWTLLALMPPDALIRRLAPPEAQAA